MYYILWIIQHSQQVKRMELVEEFEKDAKFLWRKQDVEDSINPHAPLSLYVSCS
jgi:hypothetical protein